MTFKFENLFFHLQLSKEFVAQFGGRVGCNCIATVRTLGVLKTPTLRYLQQNHRSEPKFKKN
jgi:hypothetical protein